MTQRLEHSPNKTKPRTGLGRANRRACLAGLTAGLALLASSVRPTASAPAPAPGGKTETTQIKPAVPKTESKTQKAAAAFFDEGVIPEVRIEIPPDEYKKLQADNRAYVLCSFKGTVTGKDGRKQESSFTSVGIKLKGAAGSFRGLNDRPALTLNMDKFNTGQSFLGLDKFHLNNSVQDGSLLCELISGHLFRQAGIPAARASHARVWLNKRDLGIYVLKEGFDSAFLRNHFAKPEGNLYDSGFCREIDQALEKDCGTGPDDHSDLKALRAACAVPDIAKRKEALEKVLNIDRFLTFAAMEMLTSHWDGYCRNRNNYRIYFDPADGKAVFFPHGMDQMFGDPNFPILELGGIVGSAVVQIPEFRERLHKRAVELTPLFDPEKVNPVIDAVMKRIAPVLEDMGKGSSRGYLGNMAGIKERIRQRHIGMQKILKTWVPPQPVKFDAKGELALTGGWVETKQTDDAAHETQTLPGNIKALVIKAGPSRTCIASWRREMVLPAGRYEFQAMIKTVGVVASPDGQQRTGGAGLRISGGTRTNSVDGTSDWKQVRQVIEVPSDNVPVVLVAELRASAGTAMFDAASMKLVKLKP